MKLFPFPLFFPCYCWLSWIRIRIHRQLNPGPQHRLLTLFTSIYVYSTKHIYSTSVADPGCLSRIQIQIFFPSRIPDPGVNKAQDPGSGSATLSSTCLLLTWHTCRRGQTWRCSSWLGRCWCPTAGRRRGWSAWPAPRSAGTSCPGSPQPGSAAGGREQTGTSQPRTGGKVLPTEQAIVRNRRIRKRPYGSGYVIRKYWSGSFLFYHSE